MSHSIWASRPADIYGRRKRDRLYTAVWGLGVLLGGLSSATRWTPSRVVPVGRTHTAVVTKRELLTPDVVALTFADPHGGLLPSWTPGSHVDVQLPSGRRRQYSLCGPPGRRTDYRIAVRRIADGGGGSIEMHDAFRVGDSLVFEGPRNAFYLGGDERDVLFVIGGIGVTPILSMMRAAQQRGMNWRAIYAGRSREYMPLLDEVTSLAPDRVTVWADDERGRIRHGRRSAGRCDTHHRGLRMRAERDAGIGAHRSRRARERAAALRAVQPAAGGRRHPLRTRARSLASGCSTSPPTARRSTSCSTRDPTTAHSCRQGFCGTCKVKVLSGQVDRRGRLAESDGEMLVCVSRATGGRVVIDA